MKIVHGVAAGFSRASLLLVATMALVATVVAETSYRGGYLTITLDDARRDQYLYGLPALNKYGLRGTIFLTTGNMADTPGEEAWPSMTWGEAGEWVKAGWEVGAHTETHPNLTEVSDAELKAEIAYPAMLIHKRLGVLPTSFSAPYGAFDERVRAHVSATYDAHVWWGGAEAVPAGFNSLSPPDHYNIARFEVLQETPPAEICGKMKQAGEEGLWLVLAFHGIVPEPLLGEEGLYLYSQTSFEEVVRCAAEAVLAGTLRTATIKEMLAMAPAGVDAAGISVAE